jgi:hypothetical protein
MEQKIKETLRLTVTVVNLITGPRRKSYAEVVKESLLSEDMKAVHKLYSDADELYQKRFLESVLVCCSGMFEAAEAEAKEKINLKSLKPLFHNICDCDHNEKAEVRTQKPKLPWSEVIKGLVQVECLQYLNKMFSKAEREFNEKSLLKSLKPLFYGIGEEDDVLMAAAQMFQDAEESNMKAKTLRSVVQRAQVLLLRGILKKTMRRVNHSCELQMECLSRSVSVQQLEFGYLDDNQRRLMSGIYNTGRRQSRMLRLMQLLKEITKNF